MGKKNLLLKDAARMPLFTDMRAIFRALPGLCLRHDWVLSELECAWIGEDDGGIRHELLRGGFIRGEALHDLIETREIQFIWGVFSALPKGTVPETCAHAALPWADGNRNLWVGSPVPQLRGATLEIVCWDADCTLLIGLDDDQAAWFLRSFPTAIDLDTHNRDLANASGVG